MARYPTNATLLGLAFTLLQCATDGRKAARGAEDDEPFMVPASGIDTSQENARPGEREEAPLTDEQIVKASDAAHSAAIDQARIAYAKTKDERVKKLAQAMLADHGKAKQEETELAVELHLSPADSALSTEIGVDSGKTLFAFRDAGVGSVDRTYVAAQLAAQEKYLDALDHRLIPSARDSRLKQALVAFRSRVKAHLEQTREIQQAIDGETETKSSAPSAPTGVP
jgi:predicted outer membrane protein